jgi:putative flavoprotein involved in K+ transport
MESTRTEVLVVGGGQAGIAMSRHLTRQGIPHLVIERGRIAERWRSGRWDSLVSNGPAWHDRFPDMEFPGAAADDFVPKERVADYFVAYSEQMKVPIRCGVEVTRVRRIAGRAGFRAETTSGPIDTSYVVAATGPFQVPLVPPISRRSPGLFQLHSANYRNPAQLPAGAVMVVGAGSSGVQIAEELQRAGRRVYLSVGPHERPPRRYRGRDFVWWLGVLNKWDAEATPGMEHTTIAVSGANGGHTVDFRALAHGGITLVGSTQSFDDDMVTFAPDLARNVGAGDTNYLALLDEADAFVRRHGIDLPLDAAARQFPPDPPCLSEPITRLHLGDAGVRTVIWATGYATDYSWLEVDAFDANGRPCHRRGVSSEPGVYFLGLPWLTRRGSSFIWGVWYDAGYLSDHIAKQRSYLAYLPPASQHSPPGNRS